MKNNRILILILLLTSCILSFGCNSHNNNSTINNSSHISEISVNSSVDWIYGDGILYLKCYYYEGYGYAYMIINNSGEVRTDYSSLAYYSEEFPGYITELSQNQPSYTMSDSESEVFLNYISNINPSAQWYENNQPSYEYPDVEVVHTYEFCNIGGIQVRIRNAGYYTEYLDDENAIQLVNFLDSIESIADWNNSAESTMLGYK